MFIIWFFPYPSWLFTYLPNTSFYYWRLKMQELVDIINLKPGPTGIFWGQIFTTWATKKIKDHHSHWGKKKTPNSPYLDNMFTASHQNVAGFINVFTFLYDP